MKDSNDFMKETMAETKVFGEISSTAHRKEKV